MSNRTLVELNHDFCPGRANSALVEWAAKIATYMGSGDPKDLPYGVTWKHMRHHSDPEPMAEIDRLRAVVENKDKAARALLDAVNAHAADLATLRALAGELAGGLAAMAARGRQQLWHLDASGPAQDLGSSETLLAKARAAGVLS